MDAFLACRALEKSFGGRAVLRGLDFEVALGERLVVWGPSGSGKTTLLRLLAGLDTPTGGEVREAGRLVNSPAGPLPPHRRRVGMVFQELALWPHLRAREQVELVLDRSGSRRERRGRALECLAAVALERFAERFPSELSGGERQRLAWARATASRPRLLLLDEPLSHLDPALKEDLIDRTLAYVRGKEVVLVLVTHDPSVASRVGGRVIGLGAAGGGEPRETAG